jgi:hypothetical protein
MSFDRQLQRTETSFDIRQRKVLNGESVADATFEDLPAEKIRELFEKSAQSERDKELAAASQHMMDVWTKLHPEYRDHQPNAIQLLNQTEAMFGTRKPNLEQAEAAYELLLQNGLLDIDQAELNRQKSKRDAAKAQEIEDAGGVYVYGHPSEAELYEMPMDELRRRGNAVSRY